MQRYLFTLFTAIFAFLLTATDAAAAPVLAPLVSAVSGAFAAGGFLTTFTGRLLTSVAFSALKGALATKPKTPGITTEQTATGGTNPVGFILGVSATAGDAVCPPMTHGKYGKTPNAYLTYVIALGDIAGQTLDRVAIDGAFVTLGTVAHADYGLPVTGKYDGYAWVKYYDGSQTVADPMLLAKYGSYPERPWLSDMIGLGVPYAICTFRYRRQLFSSFPSVLFECGGIKLYDPRKDTTIGGSGAHRWGQPATYAATRNNAVIAYNIARGITIPGLGTWGGSIEGADLPNASMFAAMNECDVTIGTPAVAQYRAGIEVRVDAEPAAIVEELLKGCLGTIAESGGEVKFRVGGPGLPVYFMTDDDIVVTKPQDFDPFPNAAARKNGIDAKYPDPETVWKTKSAPSRYNTTWEAEDGGRRISALDLPACPFPDQVQRLMYAYIADERRFRKHGLTLPPDAAILEPLDVVSWTSARNGYASKLFDLAEVADDVKTLLQRVSVREVDASDYSWSPTWVLPVSVGSSQPVDPPAQTLDTWAVAPLSIPDATGTARRPAIRMSWSAADMDAVDAVQYQVRVKATSAVVKIGTVSEVEGGQVILAEGIVPNTLYQARGLPVTPGRAAVWSDWLDVTSPDVRIDTVDLTPTLNTTISDTVAAAAAAQAELNLLTAGLVTDVNGALASIEARTRAGLDGWLTDPIFSRWTSGNLTATYWFSRTGTGTYATKIAGLFGSAISINVPTGTGVIQFVARSDLETNGMKGADPDAPYVVVTTAIECISGSITNPYLRPEWSNDLTTWTRGDLQSAAAATGSFSQLGISVKPGIVQTVETLWKRPAGTFAYVRLVGYPKSSSNLPQTQQVWHFVQIRAASEAERNAWNVPAMQATIDTQAITISGQTSAIATLTTNLSATNTTATNAATAAADAYSLAGSKGKVIYGSSTPVAGDQQAENLWIDTTGGINAPKRWLGGAWVIARDKVAVDAAAAAAAAQSTADALAANLATNYLTTVNTNAAIAAVDTRLSAAISPYQSQKLHSDFKLGDYYWAGGLTHTIASLPTDTSIVALYSDVNLVSVASLGLVLEAGPQTASRNMVERANRPFITGQKMRLRMKTRLVTNPSTGSHATALRVNITDASGAYLTTVNVAQFTGMVVADGWVIREYTLDPVAWRTASGNATAASWRLAVNISGLNSARQQVEWIEVEDVTVTDGLGASITDIKAVNVSALTGTALGTLLTQLAVDAGGTSALLTTQSSAIAMLNGFAAVTYSLRLVSGSAGAYFEIVATDDPVLGPASTITLAAKHIEVLASSLRISDSGNVFPDFNMADPAFYSTSNSAAFTFIATGQAALGTKYLSINPASSARSVDTGWFVVEPGEEYLVSGAAFMAATAAGQGTATLTIETGSIDAAGAITVLTSDIVQQRANLSFPGFLESINILTGAAARRARFKLTRAANGAGAGNAGGFKMQKKSGGVLIADGAITAEKMDVAFLNGERVSASFLDVDDLLTILPQAGLRYQKSAVNDDATDGLYFGVSTDGFGLAASRTDVGGKQQYIKLSSETGLKIQNARHFVSGVAAPVANSYTASGTITLPVGTRLIDLEIYGGGGGGKGGTGNGGDGAAGSNGGNTVVQLWDGATNTGISWTGVGGLGGTLTRTSDTGGSGQGSPVGVGGKGNRRASGSDATGYAAGGAGGGDTSTSGVGGAAAIAKNVKDFDVSAYANPKLVIAQGAGGLAPSTGRKGGIGSPGMIKYSTRATVPAPADVIPLSPTVTGSISKVGFSVTFPNLGAGLWVLSEVAGTNNLDIGLVDIGDGASVMIYQVNTATFMSSKTPVRLSGGGSASRAINYAFYSMGNWG
ncbi:phage tail protein [Cypionkella aquatica]|nr:phage tail protein [Cypionkella aquatica]